MRRMAIAALAGAAFLAAPAAAQDWGSLRDRLIQTAADSFGSENYSYGGFAHEGSLSDDQSEDVTIRLGAGHDFVIVGACDTDCADFDLTLYDASGNVVDSDLQLDDFPIVRANPARSGVYRLHVSMADCQIDPCRYAIQPFVK
jgi:hypothetical protein